MTSDGTRKGTVFVEEWFNDATSSEISDLVGVRGSLFFNVADDAHGEEPWVLPTTVPGGDERIVDNGSLGTSSTGSWRVSGSPSFYGANSLWAKATSIPCRRTLSWERAVERSRRL